MNTRPVKAIRNVTRNAVLHPSPTWALSSWQKARGFMFSTPGERAIIFLFLPARQVRLHMWFVFGPIDVLALDGTGRVIDLHEQFAPWSSWRPRQAASAIVELPAGAIARSKTHIGDLVILPHL